MEATAILQPVVVLVALTTVMAFVMIGTRVPKMSELGIPAEAAEDTIKLRDLLPKETVRISNNYNHLFEQPVVFYATAITIAVLGQVDALHVGCAWTYAALRIVHSAVQSTVDIVPIRFSLFLLAWIVLAIMVVRVAVGVF